jgi:pyruvate dehydrogenase complex dehydrogenase (E1) component
MAKKYVVVDYTIKGFWQPEFNTAKQAEHFAQVLTDMIAEFTARNDIRWDEVDWKIEKVKASE